MLDFWEIVGIVAPAGLFGAIASTFIHEGGHALAATLCGWKVIEIRIGPPPSAAKPGRRIGKRLVITSLWAQGHVLEEMTGPPAPWRYRLFAAAGPLANFVFLFGLLWCAFVLMRGGYEVASFAVGAVGGAQFASLLNLIPWQTKTGMTDGYALLFPRRAYAYRLELRRSGSAA